MKPPWKPACGWAMLAWRAPMPRCRCGARRRRRPSGLGGAAVVPRRCGVSPGRRRAGRCSDERGLFQHVAQQANACPTLKRPRSASCAPGCAADVAERLAVVVDQKGHGIAQRGRAQQRQHHVGPGGAPQRPRVWPKSSRWRTRCISLADVEHAADADGGVDHHAPERAQGAFGLGLQHANTDSTTGRPGCRRSCRSRCAPRRRATRLYSVATGFITASSTAVLNLVMERL